MSMEIMLRYIVGIAIAYGIGKWIYQSIRSRSIDYFLLAIIALMGAVLWLSRGFLISNRVYDFLMIVVWLVAVGCFIISRKSQYGGENGAFPPTRDGCIHSLSMRERG